MHTDSNVRVIVCLKNSFGGDAWRSGAADVWFLCCSVGRDTVLYYGAVQHTCRKCMPQMRRSCRMLLALATVYKKFYFYVYENSVMARSCESIYSKRFDFNFFSLLLHKRLRNALCLQVLTGSQAVHAEDTVLRIRQDTNSDIANCVVQLDQMI